MKTQVNLQDVFLNQVRKDKQAITIFLVSGFQNIFITQKGVAH